MDFLRRLLPIIALLLSANGPLSAQEMLQRTAASVGEAYVAAAPLSSPAACVNPAQYARLGARLRLSADVVIPYGLPDLKMGTFAFSYAFKPLALSAVVCSNGNDDSRLSSFGGGFARLFGRKDAFSASVGIHYFALVHNLTSSGISTASSFSRLGFALHPSPSWTLTFCIQNPEARFITYSSHLTPIQQSWWAAVRWTGSSIFAFVAEVQKDYDRAHLSSVVGRGAVCVRPYLGLFFTAGFCSRRGTLSASAGYDWKLWGVRASISHDAQLGPSGAAALEFHL